MTDWNKLLDLIPSCIKVGTDNKLSSSAPSVQECVVQSVDFWLKKLTIISAIVSFVFIVYGGFLMATSLGDEQKYATAKKTVIYAVIGLIISTLAFVVVRAFEALLGVTDATILPAPL